MKVLQLIDSLNIGGAERVAVNFANALAETSISSHLCVTRTDGPLRDFISKDVECLILNKKRTLDFKAISKLSRYIKAEEIDIIHAHSSSFFMAYLMKLLNPKLKLIWHDHYGKSEALDVRKHDVLKFCLKRFSHVFCVNEVLLDWAKQKLKVKNASFLSNYSELDTNTPETQLKGEDGKRLICLANFRPQKDHITLIKAFNKVRLKDNWTLHCVGKSFEDDYFETVSTLIKDLDIEDKVFIYNSKKDVKHILSQASIGIIASESEGLPLSLLEYGLSKLAVISTDVGDCPKLITSNETGILIPKKNEDALAKAISLLIKDESLRNQLSLGLFNLVYSKYSKEKTINTVLSIYKEIINE